MPVWLNLLLTAIILLLQLYLGLLLFDLKRPFYKLILIAIVAAVTNNAVEFWVGVYSSVKVIIPVIVLFCLYAYLAKTNILKSALAIIMGGNIIYFIDSITSLLFYNLLKVLPIEIFNDLLLSITGVIIMVSLCLGIIALITIRDWKLYNLSQLADNESKEYKTILITMLVLMAMPTSVYCFIVFLMDYTLSFPVDNIVIILNIANALFMAYFFGLCFLLKRAEQAMNKILKSKLDSSTIAFMQHFLDAKPDVKIDYTKLRKKICLIKNPQLRLFYQTEYTLAQERKIDFVTDFADCSGLDAYVDDTFIRMLKALYENAFEAVEAAEFKEIYSEITKDDDGGTTIIIKNNGDILPSGHHNKPFEVGYTTKSGVDRGYGLYRVKKLIDYYQGSIDLRGSDGYTQVTIKLPFKEYYPSIKEYYPPIKEYYPPSQPIRPTLKVIK